MEEAISALVQGYEKGRVTRRELVRTLTTLCGSLVGATAAAAQGTQPNYTLAGPSNLRPVSVNHINITVSDVRKSKEWYEKLFNLPTIKGPEKFADGRTAHVGPFGNTFLVLAQSRGEQDPPARIGHFCFGFDNYNADAKQADLKKIGMESQIDMNWGAPPSLLMKDPDGLLVQLSDKSYRDLRK